MDYKNISVSQFENCKSKTSVGSINIWKWLLIEPDCIQIINKIRSTLDKNLIRELKGKLPCVTMSGTFFQRNSDGLISHNGLICLDIDGKDNPHIENMEDLKLQLSKLPYVLYAGLSVSGKGVFVLIPIAYPEKHLKHFLALETDFNAMGINIDPACKDIVRLRYRSWDNNRIINLNATIYEKYADTSSIVKQPRNTICTTKSYSSHIVQPALVEEKELSIEEQFLKKHIDDNIVYNVTIKNSKEKIFDFFKYFVSREMDITVKRNDWFIICCIIKRTFGDDGRVLFHEISRFYPNYTQEECNQQYTICDIDTYKPRIRNLADIARKYGVSYDIS